MNTNPFHISPKPSLLKTITKSAINTSYFRFLVPTQSFCSIKFYSCLCLKPFCLGSSYNIINILPPWHYISEVAPMLAMGVGRWFTENGKENSLYCSCNFHSSAVLKIWSRKPLMVVVKARNSSEASTAIFVEIITKYVETQNRKYAAHNRHSFSRCRPLLLIWRTLIRTCLLTVLSVQNEWNISKWI